MSWFPIRPRWRPLSWVLKLVKEMVLLRHVVVVVAMVGERVLMLRASWPVVDLPLAGVEEMVHAEASVVALVVAWELVPEEQS